MRQQAHLEIEMVPVNELEMYEGNAKRHASEHVEQIASSIEEFNFADPIGAWHDESGNAVIVEGHGRLLAARKLGIEELPVIFLDYLSDEQRRAYTLVHNQLTMNTGFDFEVLSDELETITNIDMGEFGFDMPDLEETEGEAERYTSENKVPQYEVVGDEPELGELYDTSFADELIEEIEHVADALTDDEVAFLRMAAYRHVVFDYGKIAEFYAHASAEVQELMERSALVIIDYDDAIANGYVKLPEALDVDLGA